MALLFVIITIAVYLLTENLKIFVTNNTEIDAIGDNMREDTLTAEL